MTYQKLINKIISEAVDNPEIMAQDVCFYIEGHDEFISGHGEDVVRINKETDVLDAGHLYLSVDF